MGYRDHDSIGGCIQGLLQGSNPSFPIKHQVVFCTFSVTSVGGTHFVVLDCSCNYGKGTSNGPHPWYRVL